MIRTAKFLVISAALVAAASCAPNANELASADAPLGVTAEQLRGAYKVERVNGRRVLEDLSVQFGPSHYAGDDGCNTFFGMGLAYGDRYISGPGSQTLMGCTSSTTAGRLGLAQGRTVSNIIGRGFTARNMRNGRIELRNGENRIVIAKRKPWLTTQREDEKIGLAGRNWEAFLLNQERSKLPKTDNDHYLRFGETSFTAKFSCDTFSGNYVQEGQSLKLSNIETIAGSDCAGSDPAQEAQFRNLLEGDLRYVADKSSILIASRSGELFGDKERLKSK